MTLSSSHDAAALRLLLAARLSRKPRKDPNGTPVPDQGLGILTQDELGRAWAEREGHVVVGVAADTRPGRTPPWFRPALREWVLCGCAWCRNLDDQRGVPKKKRVYDGSKLAQFDGILAYRMDRLSRGSDEDFALIETWASVHSKRFVIVDGPQYPARDDNDYWSWAAARREAFKELETITERCGRAQRQIIATGAVVGKPPLGLAISGEKYGKTLVPTELGRAVVPEAFDRVLAGESMGQVAAWLGEQTGRTFKRKAVRDLIYCATYVGERRNAAGVTVLRCEPLLVTPDGRPDWARFRAAQKMIAAHPRQGPRASDALLSGLVRCGGCGAKMFKHTTTTAGRKYLYYQCDAGCGGRVRLDFAETAVSAIIAQTQDRPVTAVTLVPGNDFESEKQAVREEMAQLPLLGLADEEFDARMKELRAERDRLAQLKPVPAEYACTETGEGTYAQVWARLDTGGRSAFLARQKFRVYAAKDWVRLERGEGDWVWRAHYRRGLGVLDDGDWDEADLG